MDKQTFDKRVNTIERFYERGEMPLFDHIEIIPISPARETDPDTSHAAANGNLEIRGKDRITTLLALYRLGEATDFKLEEVTGIRQTSVGKRRGELTGRVKGKQVGIAYVEDSGRREPAQPGSHSMAIVWRITEEGRRAARAIIERNRDGVQQ